MYVCVYMYVLAAWTDSSVCSDASTSC